MAASAYRVVVYDGVFVTEHRLIWFLHYGYWPGILDHINRNKRDNRIENLREVTSQQNACNRDSPKTSTYGVLGVSKNTGNNKLKKPYKAQIVRHGVHYYLGTYVTIEEAKEAYQRAEAQHDEWKVNK